MGTKEVFEAIPTDSSLNFLEELAMQAEQVELAANSSNRLLAHLGF